MYARQSSLRYRQRASPDVPARRQLTLSRHPRPEHASPFVERPRRARHGNPQARRGGGRHGSERERGETAEGGTGGGRRGSERGATDTDTEEDGTGGGDEAEQGDQENGVDLKEVSGCVNEGAGVG
jgi:hypothetical protein